MIRVTYNCNKKCFYCFNNVFDEGLHVKEESLDIDVINDFITENNVNNVYISGGEPTISSRFSDLMKGLTSNVKKIVFTNGLLLKCYSATQINEFGISVIDVSFYDEDIIDENESFVDMIELIKNLKEVSKNIVVNSEIMIDSNYFKIIDSKGFKLLNSIIDNIIWQPLALPPTHPLFSTTLEGMEIEKRNEILDHLNNEFNKPRIVDSIIEFLSKNHKCVKCKMGINYIVINPDMTLSICPHLNTITTLDDYNYKDIESNKKCLSMRCLCLYDYLNKKLDKSDNI